MAKSKVQKKIEKYKNMSTTKLVGFLIVLFIAAVAYIFFQDGAPMYDYSSNQNPDTGYYYYQYDDTGDYYFQANDLEGTQLKSQLHEIINNGFIGINYGDVRYLLEIADRDLDDPTMLWNIYNGDLVDATWDLGVSWAREHVWPNSRLGLPRVSNSQVSKASDAHNLRSITPSINSSRSNRYFMDGSGVADTVDLLGFYPGDEHKGDVARILFYMATMYDDLTLTDDPDLLDVLEYESYEEDGAYMGELSLLLAWHRQDPVSDFERQRNHIIFAGEGDIAGQANRNPFIDHPEYAHLIWENMHVDDLFEPEDVADEATVNFDMWKESTLLWLAIH